MGKRTAMERGRERGERGGEGGRERESGIGAREITGINLELM
jgi:hypothetical protein